jgi:hypothetical protein
MPREATMFDTTTHARATPCVRVFLGLLLAFSVSACNGGPTEPSYDDLIRLYTGRWRGNINGFEVVLDVQASRRDVGIAFTGSGIARSTTGESHRLRIQGGTLGVASLPTASLQLMVERGGETGPGSVISSLAGTFDGEQPADGRTWSGRFTAPQAVGDFLIFGTGEYPVTLTKD